MRLIFPPVVNESVIANKDLDSHFILIENIDTARGVKEAKPSDLNKYWIGKYVKNRNFNFRILFFLDHFLEPLHY